MNIILIGYGKMGKMVHDVIKEDKDIKIVDIFDENKLLSRNKSLAGVDAAIDFSQPGAVLSNLEILAAKKVNCVLGTTGWYDELDKVKNIVENGQIGLVWDSNFSIGMNLFFELTKKCADLFGAFKEYDVCVYEAHHKGKKDSPSGTAIALGNLILENNPRKRRIKTDKVDGLIDEDALHITSSRYGSVFGEHRVFFDSAEDSIELKHGAKGRIGFAKGALLAAKWIKGKKGIYRMKDVLGI